MVIDGGLLAATAWVRGIRPSKRRLLLSATIGAGYALLTLLPPLDFMFTVLVKCALSLLMIWTAFGFVSLQHFLRNTGAFYGVNFAVAGGILGIHYLLQSSGFWRSLAQSRTGAFWTAGQIGLAFVIAAGAASLLLLRVVLLQRRATVRERGHLAEVTVFIDDKETRCAGLIDTGNRLYDPLTRTPVMVMEAALWEQELPASWLERIRSSEVDRLVAGLSADDPGPWGGRLRLVPYRGVNRGTSFMLAVKPDSVRIEREGEVYEPPKVLIGLDGGRLTADGAYRAIIHPSLLPEGGI